jgi:hypothetical protein
MRGRVGRSTVAQGGVRPIRLGQLDQWERPVAALAGSVLAGAGGAAVWHLDAGLGEPLAVFVEQSDGVRIGVFAAYALDESGHIDAESSHSFVRRVREMDCAAYLFVNGALHQQDLEQLTEGIQRDGGHPVGIATWASTAQPAPLRPDIDRLLARVRAPRDEGVTIPRQ